MGDPELSGTGTSSADALEIPVAVLAETLTGCLVRQIMAGGFRGGPLAPLAEQLNHDATHLQLQQLEGTVGRLAAELRGALAWPEIGKGAAPELESARSHQSDAVALMGRKPGPPTSCPTGCLAFAVPRCPAFTSGRVSAAALS